MYQDDPKDKRINIRLDEDTFFALKKIVENDLKTDISSYCRSLLLASTLHDTAVLKIRKAVEQFGKETNTENLEYMLKIKNEIEFMEKFLGKMKDDRKKYDEFISTIEKWHEAIKNEARTYFKKHNEIVDYWENSAKDWYGDEYDTNPTLSNYRGPKIDI